MRFVLVLALLARVAHADPAADANKAMQAFVDAVAAKKLPAEVDSFIGPEHDLEDAIGDLADVAKVVPKPTLKIVSTHLAKSGTAAWIIGEITGGKYEVNEKMTSAPLRASAFLTLDGGTWHVRAAHWSGALPNEGKAEMCGAMDPGYMPPPAIAKGAEPAVQVINDAFKGALGGKGTSAQVLAALSDAKDAQMFGSAPTESFTGGTAIKKVFKSWKIDLYAGDEHARAGIAPGGDLAWVATSVQTFWQCKSYRALFVLQKEGSAWKIVHQHYSDTVYVP
jgi:hypothetical protein